MNSVAVARADRLQKVLEQAGFSIINIFSQLGFIGWHPPPAKANGRYQYKSVRSAAPEDIEQFTKSGDMPETIVDIARLELPVSFRTEIPKQVVATKFPYGQTGIGALLHSKPLCNLKSMDFFFGGSTLEMLSKGKNTGKKNKNPYLVMKVPGTNMIMIYHDMRFGQDYSVPGFQFERLMTGGGLGDKHNVGFSEHVQILRIGGHMVLLSAEVDAIDEDGCPVEIKLMKSGLGGTTVFLQMVGSGSLTLVRGKNISGVLEEVNVDHLEELGRKVAIKFDVAALEEKLQGNMDRLKEFDARGFFEDEKVYRIDFNPDMELHQVKRRPPLPPATVVKKVLGFD